MCWLPSFSFFFLLKFWPLLVFCGSQGWWYSTFHSFVNTEGYKWGFLRTSDMLQDLWFVFWLTRLYNYAVLFNSKLRIVCSNKIIRIYCIAGKNKCLIYNKIAQMLKALLNQTCWLSLYVKHFLVEVVHFSKISEATFLRRNVSS